LNERQLLQSTLSQKHLFEMSDPVSLSTQEHISLIIQKLFLINPRRNCNESVLLGLLGIYKGTLGRADLWLRHVLEYIDEETSLNITSSSNTWNAFRTNWSRAHVEAVSSSLESPFSLIDSEITKQSVLDFDTEPIALPDGGNGGLLGSDSESLRRRSYDPFFWLPVIAYCLERVKHASDLTILVENLSIGYAFVCLSSKDHKIRKMAASILNRFECLPEVCCYY
jgi:hypothetical protein